MTTDAFGAEPPLRWSRMEKEKRRPCLRCKTEFLSSGAGERICPRCKSGILWRSSAAAPSAGRGRA